MSELRQDPTTGAIVIVAPERSRRPSGTVGARASVPAAPAFDAKCPFCPGNEAMLPSILSETPAPDGDGWQARVVPNKYPAVTPEVSSDAGAHDGHAARPGYGFHEVIIESPRHDADLARLTARELEAVVTTYHRSFVRMWERERVAAVVLFRNHGSRSGASLAHPHAQVIALDIVPPRLDAMRQWGAQKFGAAGQCPTCAELAREAASGERIIEGSEAFVALVPYAAQCPFEHWLVPRRHHASFADTRDDELADLARLLGRTLKRLAAVHDNPPYSFAIESAGPDAGEDDETIAETVHWRLRIVPDLVNWGGFERGSGMAINPSSPEADAAALRTSLQD